jgi:hypothetical protein
MATTIAQAMKELAALQELAAEREAKALEPVTDGDVARRLGFIINRAAYSRAMPGNRRRASRLTCCCTVHRR